MIYWAMYGAVVLCVTAALCVALALYVIVAYIRK
jgi:hypothetical protein